MGTRILIISRIEAGFGDINWGLRIFEELIDTSKYLVDLLFLDCKEKQKNYIYKISKYRISSVTLEEIVPRDKVIYIFEDSLSNLDILSIKDRYCYVINFHINIHDMIYDPNVINIDEYGKFNRFTKILFKDYFKFYKDGLFVDDAIKINLSPEEYKERYKLSSNEFNQSLIEDLTCKPYYFSYFASLEPKENMKSFGYYIKLLDKLLDVNKIILLTNYKFYDIVHFLKSLEPKFYQRYKIRNRNVLFEDNKGKHIYPHDITVYKQPFEYSMGENLMSSFIFNVKDLIEYEVENNGFSKIYKELYYFQIIFSYDVGFAVENEKLVCIINKKEFVITSYDIFTKEEYDYVLLKSKDIVGCTGDMSITEAMSTNRIFIYQTLYHKLNFRELLSRKFNRFLEERGIESYKDSLKILMFDPCLPVIKEWKCDIKKFRTVYNQFIEILKSDDFMSWLILQLE